MSINGKSVSRALLRKGFERKSNKHQKYRLMCDGQFMGVLTELSHGASYQISGSLRSQMARQLMLSTKDFERLVECSLDGPTYLTMVQAKIAADETSRRPR